jgi:hypothetical protein
MHLEEGGEKELTIFLLMIIENAPSIGIGLI